MKTLVFSMLLFFSSAIFANEPTKPAPNAAPAPAAPVLIEATCYEVIDGLLFDKYEDGTRNEHKIVIEKHTTDKMTYYTVNHINYCNKEQSDVEIILNRLGGKFTHYFTFNDDTYCLTLKN